MPLSEYEQRVLNELERDLGTDPKLKSAMQHAHRSGGRLVLAGLGILVGLGVVLAGVMTQVWLTGILGFVIMTASALWALSTGSPGNKAATATGSKKKGPQPKKGLMRRLEERFERRREQGDL